LSAENNFPSFEGTPLAMTTETKPVAGCGHFKKAIVQRSGGWALGLASVFGLLTFPLSQAQTFTVLHNFRGGSDGVYPEAGLVMDAKGNLYGTTYAGGTAGCQSGERTCGTVFKLAGRNETVLHRFKGAPDGANPSGSLILDAEGNLYGVTSGGGAVGCGTVFKVDPGGSETVLYSFCSNGGTDGEEPSGNLVMDAGGNLYGTTRMGGSGGSGTVFKVDLGGTETVLHSFCSRGGSRCTDGEDPSGGLVMDAAGNLYGTTEVDLGPKGTGAGAVFKVTQTGKETTLHLFSFAKGDAPTGGLIMDAAGNLYGTTVFGGTGICQPSGQNNFGCGTVFKVDASGKETVLYNFCSASGRTDGASPSAGLFMDAKGNLYGTTLSGGTDTCTGDLFPGCGTVFELAGEKQRVLHSFTGVAPDGAFPYSTLIADANGNLYGTASGGGKFGNGVVFEITP
jgi:uncharacterized repeat protein (TIGR03803 family)